MGVEAVVRKFYLQNEHGSRFDLNTTAFFTNPAGLGMSQSVVYSGAKDGFFMVAEHSKNQINPVGDIVIKSDHYATYQRLVDFITNAKRLSLVYKPTNTEYFIDVHCEYITKTELNTGVLTCPVSFRALGLWYSKTPSIYRIVQALPVENPKRYPYSYVYKYNVEDSSSRTIKANGHIDAALEISVKGALTNPKIELMRKRDNSLIGRISLEGLTVEGNKWLHISSKYNGELGVWVGGVDVSQYIDLNDNSFFRLPVNTACVLTISDDTYAAMNVWVYVYEYYLTV